MSLRLAVRDLSIAVEMTTDTVTTGPSEKIFRIVVEMTRRFFRWYTFYFALSPDRVRWVAG